MKKVYFMHLVYICNMSYFNIPDGSLHGRDCMVVCLTTTHAISAYHHYSGEFESR